MRAGDTHHTLLDPHDGERAGATPRTVFDAGRIDTAILATQDDAFKPTRCPRHSHDNRPFCKSVLV